jgi:predicted XRE-type DNA-binding protein
MSTTFVETSPGSDVWFGTGNVFYDLELPDAHERTTKMRLTVVVDRILKASKLTRKRAVTLLGITPEELTSLRGFEIDAFTAERLMHFINALQYDVLIEIRPVVAAKAEGTVTVFSGA